MSTQSISEAPSQEVGAFFQKMAESGTQPRLRTVTGICQFHVEGAGTWRLAVKKGAVTITKGDEGGTPPANCIISCSATDFLRIVRHEGNLNTFAAALQRLVTITGDMPFAWSVLASFELNPVEAGSR